ncbi:O-methyltransferase [Amorphoplanes digitatis]|uniref:Caffeoyl-CoA O-methyltransferase n=1 Tax=Actinoplanes digitatis TaxID=1868 RepID=A0A7W7HS81_9ACTN|nr:O-methyltransferase [Actinoplanes digitatis]MBB4759855.1 caffeoyl-CoA O-methyltransferase [Actinoplanes digitatis]GID94461.1 O-methyltransferase [Actinoplanes digitatis]
MTYKGLSLTADLHQYLLSHSTPPDEITADLIAETRAVLPGDAVMQVAPEQAAFLRLLTGLIGVRNAVEVGTFTGLSSLSIARGLADGGRLTCFDISEEFTGIARRYWKRAGVDDRIELRIGPAAERLRELPAEPHLDLVFVDADKGGYPAYWNELVPRVRPGGVLLIDNVLWSGEVVDPRDENGRAIAAFNDLARDDDRVELVILPIADGLTMARRR